ncbi:hypothetical protein Ndes2526B_g03561 [Nannochloris sp. 'desiccata']|nr:hypothetical protein NADE_005303 [Chlorella desiccata (nom. nud.)]
MISFEQGFGVALHGIGQAFIASSASEGAGWMQNEPLLVKEALKISQALLAVQITLVSFHHWRQVLQAVTILSTLYSAALAALYFRNYHSIYHLKLSGVVLMAIGSLLFGFGSSGRRGSQATLENSTEIFLFGPGQRKLAEQTPSTKPEISHVRNHQVRKHETPQQNQKSPFDSPAATRTTSSGLQPLPFSSHITVPVAPTAEMCAQVALEKHRSSSLPHHREHRHGSIPVGTTVLPRNPEIKGAAVLARTHDHNPPATVINTQQTATPSTGTLSAPPTIPTSTSTAPALPSHHGAAYFHSSNHRVATAFQRDPYKINLSDILSQINDTYDQNQVFTPGYFEKGRPATGNKGKAPSSSSSLEIFEEEESGEPYRLYYSEDE